MASCGTIRLRFRLFLHFLILSAPDKTLRQTASSNRAPFFLNNNELVSPFMARSNWPKMPLVPILIFFPTEVNDVG